MVVFSVAQQIFTHWSRSGLLAKWTDRKMQTK